MTDSLDTIIRTIIREELAAYFGPRAASTSVETAPPTKRVSPAGWETVDTLPIKGLTGSRDYTAKVGQLVQVAGLGQRTKKNPDGSVSGGWRITGIERRAHAGIYEHNVTVYKAGDSRIVKGDRIYYQRQSTKGT